MYLIKSKFNTVKTAILSIIIIQNVLIYFLGYIFVIGFAWNLFISVMEIWIFSIHYS